MTAIIFDGDADEVHPVDDAGVPFEQISAIYGSYGFKIQTKDEVTKR